MLCVALSEVLNFFHQTVFAHIQLIAATVSPLTCSCITCRDIQTSGWGGFSHSCMGPSTSSCKLEQLAYGQRADSAEYSGCKGPTRGSGINSIFYGWGAWWLEKLNDFLSSWWFLVTAGDLRSRSGALPLSMLSPIIPVKKQMVLVPPSLYVLLDSLFYNCF